MEWIDDAIVLSARRHGENSAVVALLTRQHGRHTGLARGGAAGRHRGIYEPGNVVRALWRGRLSEHLGTLACELTVAVAARLLDSRGRLAALTAACAVADSALPDRMPCPSLHAALEALLTQLRMGRPWTRAYVVWELRLLAELGFGLDLSRCAATGRTDHLIYVSPRSGRAVSSSAGEPYRDRLLRLPAFLITPSAPLAANEISDGLALTGYFLARHVYGPPRHQLPPARLRLAERLARREEGEDG